MTAPKINLAELRADAGAIIDDGSWLHGKTYIDPDDLLALIDAVEAANAHMSSGPGCADDRLQQALDRFTP